MADQAKPLIEGGHQHVEGASWLEAFIHSELWSKPCLQR
jgi:hypothetical protein